MRHFESYLYKALHDANWPNYLKLQLVNHSRVLRSSSGSQIQVSLIKNILQDQSANRFFITIYQQKLGTVMS